MTLLIETLYRGHSIIVSEDPYNRGRWWRASIARAGQFVSLIHGRSEAAALAEAKRRVDLLTEKPR
jgi:hypothetical protein